MHAVFSLSRRTEDGAWCARQVSSLYPPLQHRYLSHATPPPHPQPTISRAEPNYVLSQCSTALLRRYLIANVAINPVKRLHPKITPPSVISAAGSVCFWSTDDAIDNVQVLRGCGGATFLGRGARNQIRVGKGWHCCAI